MINLEPGSVEAHLAVYQAVYADGNSAGESGYEAAASVTANVSVSRLSGTAAVDAVDVTVEQSDDGNTWVAAAAALTFEADGVQSVTVDNPSAFVRIAWDVSGTNPQPQLQVELIAVGRDVADVYRGPIDVAGARDDPESALANLLTALDSAGIITDSTTATTP
jgi:hypothetical protein